MCPYHSQDIKQIHHKDSFHNYTHLHPPPIPLTPDNHYSVISKAYEMEPYRM